MEEKRSDDFGAFLESVQKAVHAGPNPASWRIMASLSQQSEIRVTHLMSQVKLPWSEFTAGLRDLEEAGLVKMEDDEEDGILKLTPDGQHWVQSMAAEIEALIPEEEEGEEGEQEV
ncbi:MAG: MarR family transcriptional regulator [Anaerolineae bacterium]|nr:MAG: MarR family transcriptional regulator [Anaerolineae bacterium]